MPLCLKINLAYKPVLLIGAGKYAKRQISKILDQNIRLTIISEKIDEFLVPLDASIIHQKLETDKISKIKEEIEKNFYIIIATNDIALNSALSNLCYDLNKLFICATAHSYASTPMLTRNDDNFILALSSRDKTKPSLCVKIGDEIVKNLKNYNKKAIENYTSSREILLYSDEMGKSFWQKLNTLDLKLLIKLFSAKRAIILHGVTNKEIIKDLKSRYKDQIIAFFAPKIMRKLCKNVELKFTSEEIINLEFLLDFIKYCKNEIEEINAYILCKGRHYENLQKRVQNSTKIIKLVPLIETYGIEALEKSLGQNLDQNVIKVFLFHRSDTLKESSDLAGKNYFCASFDDLDALKVIESTLKTNDTIAIIPLVILLGYHARIDILGARSLALEIFQKSEKNLNIIPVFTSILQASNNQFLR